MSEEHSEDARDFIRHCLATLAYRGGKVLRGAPPGFGEFKAGATSRTPLEILAHLGDLFEWASSLVRGTEAWTTAAPVSWEKESERFFATLRALDDAVAAPGPLPCPWSRLFQGPIADALTHVGQLAMLRRLAGAPVRGENYFKADVAAGRIGPDQAAPKREFE